VQRIGPIATSATESPIHHALVREPVRNLCTGFEPGVLTSFAVFLFTLESQRFFTSG
jgi:hypothetical protein